jgi:ATP-binding cassette, subfamily B, bacterial HlyB/CyaB
MDAIVGEGDDTAAELPPEVVDTGLTCLVMLARFHNVAVSAEQLSHEMCWPDTY